MDTQHLQLLTKKNLQSSLLERQLSKVPNTVISSCLADRLVYTSNVNHIDLVIIDFCYLEELSQSNQLPDFDLLGLNLLVHNVPAGQHDLDFIRWRSLKGILPDNATLEHLTSSVAYILEGGLWLPRQYLEQMIHFYRTPNVFNSSHYETLTNRERQILDLVAHGLSNQQIANQLFLAESTVKTHLFKLYRKLHVHKRKDAIKLMHLIKSSSR